MSGTNLVLGSGEFRAFRTQGYGRDIILNISGMRTLGLGTCELHLEREPYEPKLYEVLYIKQADNRLGINVEETDIPRFCNTDHNGYTLGTYEVFLNDFRLSYLPFIMCTVLVLAINVTDLPK